MHRALALASLLVLCGAGCWACGGDDGPTEATKPVCSTVIAHFYAEGCSLQNFQGKVSEQEARTRCEQLEAQATGKGGTCPDAWAVAFSCMGAVTATTCASCDAELQALYNCL